MKTRTRIALLTLAGTLVGTPAALGVSAQEASQVVATYFQRGNATIDRFAASADVIAAQAQARFAGMNRRQSSEIERLRRAFIDQIVAQKLLAQNNNASNQDLGDHYREARARLGGTGSNILQPSADALSHRLQNELDRRTAIVNAAAQAARAR